MRSALLCATAPEPPEGLEDEIISTVRAKRTFSPASLSFAKIAAVVACVLLIGLALAFHGMSDTEERPREANATSPVFERDAGSQTDDKDFLSPDSPRGVPSAKRESSDSAEPNDDMLQMEEAEKEMSEEVEGLHRSNRAKLGDAAPKEDDSKHKNTRTKSRTSGQDAEGSRDNDKTEKKLDKSSAPRPTSQPLTRGYGKGSQQPEEGSRRPEILPEIEKQTMPQPRYHYFEADGTTAFVKGGKFLLKAERKTTVHLPHIGTIVLEKSCEIALVVRDIRTGDMVELPGLALEESAKKLEVVIFIKQGSCTLTADGVDTKLTEGRTYSLRVNASPQPVVE
ncbi:MAG: hypothetical protein U5N86_07585 [Planctomycetota bacterium]|nr:hypothetical protein [Planctomycetota bacterium]